MPIISGNEVFPPNSWKPVKENIYRAEIFTPRMGKVIAEGKVLKEVGSFSQLKPGCVFFNWASKEFIELTEKFEKEIIFKDREVKEGDKFNGKVWKKVKVDENGFLDFEKIYGKEAKNSVIFGISYIFVSSPGGRDKRCYIPGGFRGARMTGTGPDTQLNRYHIWINKTLVKAFPFSTYENPLYEIPLHWPYYGVKGGRIDGFSFVPGLSSLAFGLELLTIIVEFL